MFSIDEGFLHFLTFHPANLPVSACPYRFHHMDGWCGAFTASRGCSGAEWKIEGVALELGISPRQRSMRLWLLCLFSCSCCSCLGLGLCCLCCLWCFWCLCLVVCLFVCLLVCLFLCVLFVFCLCFVCVLFCCLLGKGFFLWMFVCCIPLIWCGG